jgi:hypothetical protein
MISMKALFYGGVLLTHQLKPDGTILSGLPIAEA